MSFTATPADYRQHLAALLPPGPFWAASRRPGTVFFRVLLGLAAEFARVHNAALLLIAEADPRTTTFMLPDWERELGLPDQCSGELPTIEQRRQAVLSRLVDIAPVTPQDFINLAASLGYAVTIEEGQPLVYNHPLGPTRRYKSYLSRFKWTVFVLSSQKTPRRYGKAFYNERYLEASNPLLECLFRRFKPAHTAVEFVYVS